MCKVIMTVDDSASLRMMVSFSLREAGYQIIEAADGIDALAKLNGHPVHLIITDMYMPNMDGIQLIKSIRKNPAYRRIPIIMLTTEGNATKKETGKEAGATGWIVKPFKPQQLVAVVKKIIG